MNDTAMNTVNVNVPTIGLLMITMPATVYKMPTNSCSSSPLQRPAQKAPTIVAAPAHQQHHANQGDDSYCGKHGDVWKNDRSRATGNQQHAQQQ